MASLLLRDISLNQTAITGRRKTEVQVVDARLRYKIDEATKQRTDEVEMCVVDIIAAKNKPQSVKLPAEFATVVGEQVKNALEAGKLVFADFGTSGSTLRGKPYAMYRDGNILSGISCTASEFNVLKIEDADVDTDFDDIEI